MSDLMQCNLKGANFDALMQVIGKEITGIALAEVVDSEYAEELHIRFKDSRYIRIMDSQASCCERRYMTTDDNLNDYIGSSLLNIEIKPAPIPVREGDDGDAHEIEFLEVTTTKGSFAITNHNEHNGYYGGFDIEIISGVIA